ncbi:hypothetical protein NM688_g5187 [Phlebia brevispora]|uniref:Uncharacterized protein n=1 Tax=Phlebia brevispora TaxID=194682 RepID=A0ACC1SYX7_9APHY|nr:hypothetical protein NM688_g5187 [Phlebia brevispora]
MLSAFRHTLREASRCSGRALSTATAGSASSAPLSNPALVEQGGSAVKDVVSGLYASPIAQPLYLGLSSLVPPKEDDPQPLLDKVVELDPFIFAHPIRRDILHLCVVHHLDSLRQGSASTKTRGDVRGSGRKIRPQKGTGMARLGDGQSPMLRGGGVAFGPKPRDFSTKLPRKVIQMGMRVALSARLKERGLGVVESLDWPGFKTKEFAARLKELGWDKTLFVTGLEDIPEGLQRSSGNIQRVETSVAEELTVYDIMKWPRVVLDVPAIEWFERKLGRQPVESH